MRRLLVLLLIMLLVVSSAAAQQAANYVIRDLRYNLTDDQVLVDFTVNNYGGAVLIETTVYLFDEGGRNLAHQVVKPLSANEKFPVTLSVQRSQFTPGSSQTLYIAVGVNQLPAERSQISHMTVPIPEIIVSGSPAAAAQNSGGLPINLSDPTNLALIIGIVVVVIVLLWVITVIGRLVFSRPPALPAWQPPYVITPLIDPNSTNGRRQLWQQHAESDVLPAPCAQGDYKVRKLLIGSNAVKLAGWRVTGLRISQYDRYGRVARSQTVLPKKTVKALDKAVRKSASLDSAKALRTARPIARALTKTILKKSNKQSATLPVALDIRLVGMHGEVRILFELYGCNGGSWQEIDHWEPEMRVVNGSIHENFTYTLLGQYPAESNKQYQQRLAVDLTNLLALMIQAPPPPPPPAPEQDTAENAVVSE
ncbi:MAG: hypothetical protein ABI700_22825 [Chloroflexota bacterium]